MNETPSLIEVLGTLFFSLAVLHTFLTSFFQKMAVGYTKGSILENLFHLLGEVEVVFGLWAGVFILARTFINGWNDTLYFTDQMNFTEPIFVFTIMSVASTKPIIDSTKRLVFRAAQFIPGHHMTAVYFICLAVGPLLGSFITEPAAMTVIALILYSQFYTKSVTQKFRYTTIAALFVNVSIGGVLSNYAAPPVLMVADTWQWSTHYMFFHFGWKAAIATLINATMATVILSGELKKLHDEPKEDHPSTPLWLVIIHFIFLILIVLTSHHSTFCMGIFLFFLGITSITSKHQTELQLRQSLLVAFFLAGLVVFGTFQSWWLSPLLENLGEGTLFIYATALTAFTDNAALTYLGSLISGLSDELKYALVAGAVSGGGLTVIANAPNPAGFSILQKSFGPEGIRPTRLFFYAIPPTIIAMLCFWFL